MGGRLGLSGPAPLPQHHTTGVNCELCLPGFYRSPDHPLDSPHTCRREWGRPRWGTLGAGLPRSGGCGGLGVPRPPAPRIPGPAHRSGSQGCCASPHCPDGGGRGACRGRAHCAGGLTAAPAPRPPGCDCESEFTDGTCEDLTGRCYCRRNFTGERCEACAAGFEGFPHCHREARAARGRGGAGPSCPAPSPSVCRAPGLTAASLLPSRGPRPQQQRGADAAGGTDRE